MNGTGRAVTSAYPGVQEDDVTDQFLAPLDVAGYNYGWSHYEPGHARVPSRVIAGTESFPLQSFQTWKGTALSGSISTVLTVLSWICVGIHSRRALHCPVCG